MSCNFKKTISVILLFIFLYNTSGYYFTFTIQQSEIKETVQNFLEEKNSHPETLFLLIILQREQKNLAWNGNEEFSLNGKMYDVAFKKIEGNRLFLYCYNDSKEDHLFASLNTHVKNNISIPVSQKNSKNTLKNPLPDYFMNFNKNELSFFSYKSEKEMQHGFLLLDFYVDKPSPPPRLA